MPQLIKRIIHEHHPFVNITEHDLELEINGKDVATPSPQSLDDGAEGSDVDTGPLSVSSQNERFYKDKNEALKHISMALNESSLSLDFVSLLISCVRPAAGTISMSAHLKKFVPPGSFNSDLVQSTVTPQAKEEQFKEEKIIGQGWKLSSLEASSDTLHNAGARLSEEVHREKIFWDTIKKNFNNKEILYKTRDKVTGKRVFAVKYGYADSGSTYRVKGSVMLKPMDGSLELVPIVEGKKTVVDGNRVVRVRIWGKRDGEDELIGESKSRMDEKLKSDGSIRSKIEKLRYFIFEEELFNQLMDEAVGLIAYNVKIESETKISIESHDEMIEVEYVEYVDEAEDEDTSMNGVTERSENNRAELFATYLRLMLTLKHKENLESKSQPTVLKSSNTRTLLKPYSLLLKPLVGRFRHQDAADGVYNLLKTLTTAESKLQVKKYCNITTDQLKQDPFKKISTPGLTAFQARFTGALTVRVDVDSFDFVNYVIHTKATFQGKPVLSTKFEDVAQLEECLKWLMDVYK